MKKNIKSRILFHFECQYGEKRVSNKEIQAANLCSALDSYFGSNEWKIVDWLGDDIPLVITTKGEIWRVKKI
jgi:hypothetical protein